MPSITCTAGEMTRALKNVVGVAGRGDIAVLSNVLIEVGKSVSLTASNSVQQVTHVVDFDHDGKFSITVDAARLAAIAGALDSDAPMSCELDGEMFIVRSKRSKYQFQTLPADIFPRMVREKGDKFAVDAEFRAALDGVRHAVGTSEVAWTLMGVALHVRDGNLEVFATDSNRMALRSLGQAECRDTIIPTVAIDLISKVDDETASMIVGEKSVSFEYGNTVLITKVIDSKVTAYGRLLGWEPEATLSLPRKDAVAALNRLLLVAEDKDRSVIIDATQELATLTNAAGDEQLSCDCTAPIRIGFKAQFLREVFASLSGDEVQILIANPNSPVIIKSSGDPDATLICGTFRV